MNHSQKIYSLQALRAYAAVLVCFAHVHYCTDVYADHFSVPQYTVLDQLEPFFRSGVDLFFIISGFIISYVVKGKKIDIQFCKSFLLKRVLRIYPLYWLTLTAYIAYTIILGGKVYALKNFLSYTLYPGIRILPISWSLTFEVMFYLMFAIALLISMKRNHLYSILIVVVTLFYFSGALLPVRTDPHGITMSPLVFEFIFGIFIFQLYQRKILLSRGAAFVAIFLYFVAVAYNVMTPSTGVFNYEYVMRWGLSSSLFVYALLSIEALGFNMPKSLIYIGDSSYSLYLSHPLIMMFIAKIWVKMNIPPVFPTSVLTYVLVAMAICFAMILFLFVEKPLLAQSYKFFLKKKSNTARYILARKTS